VRIAAIRALSDAGDAGSRLLLEDRARIDPEISVRQNAIQAYGKILKDQAVPVLEDLLTRDPNIRIKASSISTLLEVGGPDARRVLERYSTDPSANEDARARATGALAAMDRAQQGGGLPSIGGKLDAVHPENITPIGPIRPIGGAAAGDSNR
jgi:HEAT repeat protein